MSECGSGMKQPLVSVCCLVYNHESYLRDCLDGFVAQKTTFPIEILIYDDASCDGSVELIKTYTKDYPDIFKPVFQTENQFSLGKGYVGLELNINRAQGKYIALCEGDDYWIDPYKLQKQVEYMESHYDCALVYHNAVVKRGESKNLFIGLNVDYHKVDLNELLMNWSIPTASVLFRNDSISFPDVFHSFVNGDYALELLLHKKGYFYYMPSIMSVYRRHAESVSAELNANPIEMYDRLVDMLEYMKQCYEKADGPLFDKAIEKYRSMGNKVRKEMKYPFLRFFDWRYYKRLVLRKLKLKRVG